MPGQPDDSAPALAGPAKTSGLTADLANGKTMTIG